MRVWWLLAGALALGTVWSWVAVELASAYTEPLSLIDGHDYTGVCPPRPADYSGEDAVVGALTTEQLAAASDARLAAIEGAVSVVKGRLDGWQSTGLPGFVSVPDVSVSNWPVGTIAGGASSADVESVRVQVERSGWFIVGALAGILFFRLAWRMLVPYGRDD